MPIADLTKKGETVWYRFHWKDDDDMVNMFTIDKETKRAKLQTKLISRTRARAAWDSHIEDGYKVCRFPE